MVKKQILVGHLYPKQMNVYGDIGNIITLKYRLEKRGFGFKYVPIETLRSIDDQKVDIIVGGGGQDSNQMVVHSDLLAHGEKLKALLQKGVAGLMVCGMYQLMGHKFVDISGNEICGIGLFDMETIAQHDRLIGNIVVKSDYGELVGFENHSGRTYLNPSATPLGRVTKGAGNNNETGEEGVIYNNCFGTYMHGPVLSKNPLLADQLIVRTLKRKGWDLPLIRLNDDLEKEAAKIAARRPR